LSYIGNNAINDVAFNPFKPNLLATGSDEVLILNLDSNINDPELFSPGDNSPHGETGESMITSISWNKKILHILASASDNSTIVVWDLKTNQPIFDFSNAISEEPS